jgi:hypothetical protein
MVMTAVAALALATVSAAPAHAQAETSVTGASAGNFGPGVSYLGVSLSSLNVGMGLSVAGTWGLGQFQATLIGASPLGPREIMVDGRAASSVPSAAGTALFSGACTVDPGDGTPPVSGVPFTVAVTANPDGTGTLALTLGATSLPAAALNEGYLTIRLLDQE